MAAVLLVLALAAYGLPQQPAAKRPLNHADYDSWRSIQTPVLSRDGRFLAYLLMPQEGDGEVVVRNLASGVEWRHARGGRSLAAGTKKAGAGKKGLKGPPQGGQAQTSQLAFTADGRFLLFTFLPVRAEPNPAKTANKPAGEGGQTSLGIMDLATGKVTTVPRVTRFQVAEEEGRLAVYLLAAPGGKAAAKASADGRPAGADTKKKQPSGSDLVIHNLANHATRVVPEVVEFSLTKDGRCLVYTVASKTAQQSGLYAMRPDVNGAPAPLLTGRGRYAKLTWDERQTRLAFLSDRDEADATPPRLTLYCWERKPPRPIGAAAAQQVGLLLAGWPVAICGFTVTQPLVPAGELAVAPPVALVSTKTPHFRSGMVISDKGALNFAQDGGRIFFGVAPPEPAQEKESAIGDRVVVDLWHWKDDFIQPMQKVRAQQERGRTYRAVYHLKERKFTQLADRTLPRALPSREGRWALGVDDQPYRILVGYDTTYADYHLLDTLAGSRRELRKKQQGTLSWSPGGKYALFFDGGHWNSLAIPSGRVTDLTGRIPAKFYFEDFDAPSTPPAHGVAGWTKDDRFVLLYDRYDVWQVAADGSGANNLTGGLGRETKTQFRVVRLGGQDKALDPDRPLLLRAENLQTRDTGFYRTRQGGPAGDAAHGGQELRRAAQGQGRRRAGFDCRDVSRIPGPLRDGRRLSRAKKGEPR
jgi:hypothetical protein